MGVVKDHQRLKGGVFKNAPGQGCLAPFRRRPLKLKHEKKLPPEKYGQRENADYHEISRKKNALRLQVGPAHHNGWM